MGNSGAKEMNDAIAKLTGNVAQNATKTNLEITNAVVMKLHDSIEARKSDISALQANLATLDSKVMKNNFDQNKASTGVDELKEDLVKFKAAHEQTRAATTQIRN